MVLKYYYPKLKIDWKKFNRIMHQRKAWTYTLTLQLGILLDHFGLRARVFSQEDSQTTAEDPGQFRRYYKQDYDKLIKRFDIPVYNWAVKECRKRKLFRRQRTRFSGLIEWFKKGYLIIFPVDWNTLKGKKGIYEGHFVVLAGIKKGGRALIHDPDEKPYRSYPIKTLARAYNHPVITDDVVVVYGRK